MTGVALYSHRSGGGHFDTFARNIARLLEREGIGNEVVASAAEAIRSDAPVFLLDTDYEKSATASIIIRRVLADRSTVAFLWRTYGQEPSQRRSLAKSAYYLLLKLLPRVTPITVVGLRAQKPYRSTELVDSEYWDHSLDGEGAPVFDEALYQSVRELAAGRPVVLAIGGVRKAKGTGFLLSAWAASALHEDFCLVVAGIAEDVAEPTAETFGNWRALRIRRRLSDAEWAALIATSDLVWACYAPDYDRSSGVAGRALQAGKSVVIRKGSLLEQDLAPLPGLVTTNFDDVDGLTVALMEYKKGRAAPLEPDAVVGDAIRHSSALLQSLADKAAR